MSDIRRNIDNSELIRNDKTLLKMQYITQISEMMNQLKALEVEIDRIKTVDLKKVELKKAELKKRIEVKNEELRDLDVIVVQPEKKEDK